MRTSRGPSGPRRDADDAPVGERRRARERALGLLYEAEVKGISAEAVLDALPVPPEVYAAELVRAASRRAAEIDRLVAGQAAGWRLDRMPAIDRQVLRLATCELLERPDVPTAVVLDEAVELAKAYSTEDSGRFVNGVLAALARKLRPEAEPSSPGRGEAGTEPRGVAS